ncbi:dihydrodipicolinate synthetase, partial [Salmonella enterica subsp. enterica serovar Enteritidis str. 6.0562-1]
QKVKRSVTLLTKEKGVENALSTIYSLDSPFFGIIKKAIQLSGVDISTHVMPPRFAGK